MSKPKLQDPDTGFFPHRLPSCQSKHPTSPPDSGSRTSFVWVERKRDSHHISGLNKCFSMSFYIFLQLTFF